ncbi:MAG: DUF4249 domain-containing protein [Bacteroidota bacterium]
MKKILYSALLLIALASVACKEAIDLNLEDEKYSRLVVEGNVTDQYTRHTVLLTSTSPYDQNVACPKASGATVSLNDGTSTWALTETEPGVYMTDSMAGEIGKTYTLSIQYKGESFSAISVMKPSMTIDSLTANYLFTADNMLHYEVQISGQDNPIEEEYFLGIPSLNGEKFNEIYFWCLYSDQMTNGTYLKNYSLGVYELFPGLILKIEWQSISKEYFDFIYQLMMNSYQDPMFSGPPANVKGNISNGALGYFSASAVTSVEKIIP